MPRGRLSFPREKYRRRLHQHISSNRARILGLLATFAVGALVDSLVVHGYVLGFLHGCLLTLFFGLVLSSFLTTTNSTWLLCGIWGEQNTSEVLKKAKKCQLIWGWIDGLEIEGGDVDHLVLTRSGCLVAIDSKWHTEFRPRTAAEDAIKAITTARRANLILRSLHHSPNAAPVVVVWGRGAHEVSSAPESAEVPIIAGHDLLGWLDTQPGPGCEKAAANELFDQLRTFKRRVKPPHPTKLYTRT